MVYSRFVLTKIRVKRPFRPKIYPPKKGEVEGHLTDDICLLARKQLAVVAGRAHTNIFSRRRLGVVFFRIFAIGFGRPKRAPRGNQVRNLSSPAAVSLNDLRHP